MRTSDSLSILQNLCAGGAFLRLNRRSSAPPRPAFCILHSAFFIPFLSCPGSPPKRPWTLKVVPSNPRTPFENLDSPSHLSAFRSQVSAFSLCPAVLWSVVSSRWSPSPRGLWTLDFRLQARGVSLSLPLVPSSRTATARGGPASAGDKSVAECRRPGGPQPRETSVPHPPQ